MNCKDVAKVITDFLSGEITPQEKKLLLKHLDTCRECRQELSALAGIEEKLGLVFKLSTTDCLLPDNALESLKEKIALEEQSEGRKQNWTELILRVIKPLNWRLNLKTGLAGALVVSLVIIIAVTIPLLFGKNSKVLAVDIALKNSQVQAAIGDRDINRIKDVDTLSNGENVVVVLDIDAELLIITEVNTQKEEVVQVSTLELNDEKKQEITAIASTDPGVQSLLDRGAEITEFNTTYNIDIDAGRVDLRVNIWITLNGKKHIAIIDPEGEKVLSLIALPD